jgi:hypothetical protein
MGFLFLSINLKKKKKDESNDLIITDEKNHQM